jgi:hypothetical protein
MLLYALIITFISSAFAITLAPAWSRHPRLLALLPLLGAFVFLYLFVGDEVAQDRNSYYQWYLSSTELLADPQSRDHFFSFLLYLLPEGLSRNEFGIIFSALVFSLIAGFFLLLAKRGVIRWGYVPLILLVIMCDRQFFDMSLNTTRSSLSGIIFLFGLVSNLPILKALLWLLSFGIHGLFFIFLILIYGVSILARKSSALLKILSLIGILAFCLRLIFGLTLGSSFLLSFDRFTNQIESEAVLRGLSTTGELTPSLTVQTVFALILPLILILYRYLFLKMGIQNQSVIFLRKNANLFSFSIVTTFVALVLYPDLMLSQRLFLISIVCLPIYLDFKPLLFLAVFKFFVIALALPPHIAISSF